jgi:hypothetical protein
MPEKKIGKIFEQYQAEGCQYCGGGEGDIYIPKECWDAIIIEIRKLTLEGVGKDIVGFGFDEKSYNQGYNQAKQEIRKRVEDMFAVINGPNP